MLDGSSSIWFYWPMLGTGIGVAITRIVLLGIGGLFGRDWERREIETLSVRSHSRSKSAAAGAAA